jgi:hypothetical protein
MVHSGDIGNNFGSNGFVRRFEPRRFVELSALRSTVLHRMRTIASAGLVTSVTTVDQADMRALVSRETVVRHGAASL